MRTSSSSEKRFPLGKIILVIFFILAYTAVFPRVVPKEFSIRPVALTPVELKTQEGTGDYLFRMGDQYGGLDKQGALIFAAPAPSDLAISGTKYSFYEKESNSLVVMKAGQRLFTLPEKRYSHWIGERLFTLEENRFGASEVSSSGQLLWERVFPALITSMDAGKALSVFGLTSGTLAVMDSKGSQKFTFTPGGSRLPVIYNTCIAPDDDHLAILSGVDPKRFILMDRSGDEFRPVFHKNVDDNSRFPTPLGFLGNGTYVYYYNGSGISLVRTSDFQIRDLTFDGSLDFVELDQGQDLLSMITRNQGQSQFEIFSLGGPQLLEAKFNSRDSFVKTIGDLYFLGIDGMILVLQRVEG